MRGAVIKALVRSLALSAAVMIPGLFLLLNGAQIAGMLWLLGGSFGMVAWTYRKPWRLGLISCLIPPIAAGIGYLVQLMLFSNAAPSFVLVLAAAMVGVGIGWYRAETHQVYEKDGSVFAQRTIAYLGIWIAAYVITQVMALLASNVWMVRSGLLTGAFSTAMLAVVSVVILRKRKALMRTSIAALAFGAMFAYPAVIAPAGAQWASDEVEVVDILGDAAGKISRVVLDAEVGRAVLGLDTTGKPTVVPLASPQLQRISNDIATATYVTDASSSIVVTLRRLESAEAAVPRMSELQGFPSQMVRWVQFRGLSYLFGMNIKDETPPSADALAMISKDRFQISVRASVTVQPKPPSPSRGDQGFGEAIVGGAMEGLGEGLALIFVPMFPIPIAAEYYAVLDPSAYQAPERSVEPPPIASPNELTSDDHESSAGTGTDYDLPAHINISPEDVAAGTAAVAAILIAAGIAANIAQAIAAAMAASTQSGVEMTTEEISAAIAHGHARTAPVDQDVSPIPDVGPPPKPPPEIEGEEPSFMGAVWQRVSSGIAEIGSEIAQAGRDVYQDPSLIWETVKGSAGEVYDTTRDLGGRALTGMGDVLVGTAVAASDIAKDPSIIVETITGTLSDIAEGTAAMGNGAARIATDVAQAGKDIYENPELFGDTLVGMQDDIESAAAAVEGAVTDPDKVVNGVKILTGIQSIEDSLDPNRPLTSRIGQVGLGVLGIYGTITGVQGLANGGSSLVGKLTGGGSALGDDAARIAAGATDDAARLGSGVADDVAASTGPVADDAVAGASGVADDAAHGARGSVGAADDVGGASASASTADDAAASAGAPTKDPVEDLREQLRGQKRGVTDTPEHVQARQDYGEHLKRRGDPRGDSSIRPGDPSDLSPAQGVVPDTSGYTRVSEKHIQAVADKHGVKIYTRPTNPHARELLENRRAVAKPELVKNKSMNEIDMLIAPNADPSDLGKVGNFNPVDPPSIGSKLPDGRTMSAELHEAATKRAAQRAQEFKDQANWIKQHADDLEQHGNLLIDKETGLPFTGDIDGFTIRGMHNETLPKAVVDEVQRELLKGPAHVKHGFHTEWNYSGYDRAAQAGGGQSKFDIARGIDGKIRTSHAPTVALEGGKTKAGEALVGYGAKEGLGAPNPTASFWRGGSDNPLIKN